MIGNRRSHARQIINSPIYVVLGSNSGGLLYDISEGGLAVDIVGPMLTGELIALGFEMRETERHFEASGQVAWKKDPGNRAGLRFVNLPDASHQQIKEWLSVKEIPGGFRDIRSPGDAAKTEWCDPPSTQRETLSETPAPGSAAAVLQPLANDVAAPGYTDARPTAFTTLGSSSAGEGTVSRNEGNYELTDLRHSLFPRATVGESRGGDRATPEQARRNWQRRRKLILAGLSICLATLALIAGIAFFRFPREPISAAIGEIRETVSRVLVPGTVPSSKPIMDMNVTRPEPRGRGKSKGHPDAKGGPPASSVARLLERKSQRTKQARAYQVEVVEADNLRRLVTPRGGANLRLGFQGPANNPAGDSKTAAGGSWGPASVSAANVPSSEQNRVTIGECESSFVFCTLRSQEAPVGPASASDSNPLNSKQSRVTEGECESGFVICTLRAQQVSAESPMQQVMPAYPPLALARNIQGRVVLQVVIAKNGSIQNIRLVSGPPILASVAVDAVKQWRYKPHYRNGEPVEVERQISIDFTISPN